MVSTRVVVSFFVIIVVSFAQGLVFSNSLKTLSLLSILFKTLRSAFNTGLQLNAIIKNRMNLAVISLLLKIGAKATDSEFGNLIMKLN
jgi:hypothetical protein